MGIRGYNLHHRAYHACPIDAGGRLIDHPLRWEEPILGYPVGPLFGGEGRHLLERHVARPDQHEQAHLQMALTIEISASVRALDSAIGP